MSIIPPGSNTTCHTSFEFVNGVQSIDIRTESIDGKALTSITSIMGPPSRFSIPRSKLSTPKRSTLNDDIKNSQGFLLDQQLLSTLSYQAIMQAFIKFLTKPFYAKIDKPGPVVNRHLRHQSCEHSGATTENFEAHCGVPRVHGRPSNLSRDDLRCGHQRGVNQSKLQGWLGDRQGKNIGSYARNWKWQLSIQN